MNKPLNFNVDRSAKTSLSEQIRKGIVLAIESGVLAHDSRHGRIFLPSLVSRGEQFELHTQN